MPRVVGAITASALVVVLALVAGDRLAALRNERAGASPSTATVPPALSHVAPDHRYGLLVRLPGKTTDVALIDELGHEVIPQINGLVEAKTSPNGRYIALWLQSADSFELRMLDGVTRTIGAPLFTTSERFARQSLATIWASDSSAVLVATTADSVANGNAMIDANLRAIDLKGNVRLVQTIRTFALAPLAWDRTKAAIVVRSVPQQHGANQVLLRISEDGSARSDTTITDDPLIANDAGTYIAAAVPCVAQAPCRRYAIHDAATYAVVSQIDLPDLVSGSGMTSIQFRPRSSDVLVNFSRSLDAGGGQFALMLYPDAGRGKPRDFGTFPVKAVSQPDPKAQAAVPTPNAVIRADGSAAFFVHTTTIGTLNADSEGFLVELNYGSGAGVKTRQPITSIVLDPSLVLGAPTTSPSALVPAR